MKTAILTPAEKQVIGYHTHRQAARQILITAMLALAAALIALHTALLAVQRYQPSPPPAVIVSDDSDGQAAQHQARRAEQAATAAIPDDWTENPLAGVVYEPIGQAP
ncbi:hypothetical protein [Neisseria dentiae]|uniref:hypothetical protein n=1 Tax=Neisseria dentiae TaxID=194197 RepID=UPI0035A16BD7